MVTSTGFVRPTLSTLISQARVDIETNMTGADAHLRRSTEAALARACAGLAHGNYGNLVWLAKQLIPDTADDSWLVRWASIYGFTKVPATNAKLTIGITGTNSTVCPISTQWATNDGLIFKQDADVTIAAGVAAPTITAAATGTTYNLDVGSTVTLVTPVTGIDSTGTVTVVGTVAVDLETSASLLERLLYSLRNPSRGGGPGDYVTWAREYAGCTRAWELARFQGVGTVALWYVADASSPIIPADVTGMQAWIDSKAPLTAEATVLAPTGADVNFAIQLSPGGVGADTAAIRAAVVANLTDLIYQKQTPLGMTLYLIQLQEAIASAVGVTNYLLTSPAGDLTYVVGGMPIMGAVTFS
jgi:uncharacterized phage protein gp47/JayE